MARAELLPRSVLGCAVEIVIALALTVALAAICIYPTLRDHSRGMALAKRKREAADLDCTRFVLLDHHRRHGRYPADWCDAWMELTGWRRTPTDAWGSLLRYDTWQDADGAWHSVLRSDGQDKRPDRAGEPGDDLILFDGEWMPEVPADLRKPCPLELTPPRPAPPGAHAP